MWTSILSWSGGRLPGVALRVVAVLALLDLSVDSDPEVANLACTVVDFVIALLLEVAMVGLQKVLDPVARARRGATPADKDVGIGAQAQ